MIEGFSLDVLTGARTPVTVANVPAGAEPLILAEMARAGRPVAYVVSDGQHMGDLEQMLRFVAPEIPVLTLPAWDCLPYDRVSPSTEAAARRIAALTALIEHARTPHPAIVLVSVNALVQKAPPRAVMEGLGFTARAGSQIGMDGIIETLQGHGFERVPTVREVGEYAVRGGILDVYVPGADAPLRLDFFGNTLETVRSFDPATQRTVEQGKTLDLHPMSEVTLTPETISRFRTNYLASFGAATRDDALYQAISEGRRFAGMEHWLPLFYEELETTFDYLRGFIIVTDHLVGEAAAERYKQVEDHYVARRHAGAQSGAGQGTPYKPVEPASLYVSADTITQRLDGLNAIRFSPFDEPETGARRVVSLSARPGPRWARAAMYSTPSFAISPSGGPAAARYSSPAGRKVRSTGSSRSSASTGLSVCGAFRRSTRYAT
jgi:transcription-repair coupling factor (superfamily II helicase)